jgi:hypothetical protein
MTTVMNSLANGVSFMMTTLTLEGQRPMADG